MLPSTFPVHPLSGLNREVILLMLCAGTNSNHFSIGILKFINCKVDAKAKSAIRLCKPKKNTPASCRAAKLRWINRVT